MEVKVLFVDMCVVILAATGDGTRWAEFHFDAGNCHPTDRGHEVWAEAALAALKGGMQ